MVKYGFYDSEDEAASDESDFLWACAKGDLTLVQAFMGGCNCRTLFEERDSTGRTPLKVAIDNDQIEIAEALLRSGECSAADVNAGDDNGWTAMTNACAFTSNKQFLQKLTQAGTGSSWKNEDESSLEDLARRKENKEATFLLEKLRDLQKENCVPSQPKPGLKCPAEDTQNILENAGKTGESICKMDEDKTEYVEERKECETICSICESSPVDVTLAPCQHSVCDECSKRWKRCHVTLLGSICGIACGAEITGRWRKIPAIVEEGDQAKEEDEEEEERKVDEEEAEKKVDEEEAELRMAEESKEEEAEQRKVVEEAVMEDWDVDVRQR